MPAEFFLKRDVKRKFPQKFQENRVANFKNARSEAGWQIIPGFSAVHQRIIRTISTRQFNDVILTSARYRDEIKQKLFQFCTELVPISSRSRADMGNAICLQCKSPKGKIFCWAFKLLILAKSSPAFMPTSFHEKICGYTRDIQIR